MASKIFEHPALFKFGTLVSMEELTDGQNIAGQQSQTTSLRKDIYKAEINACYVGRSSFFAHFCVNASSKRKADGIDLARRACIRYTGKPSRGAVEGMAIMCMEDTTRPRRVDHSTRGRV